MHLLILLCKRYCGPFLEGGSGVVNYVYRRLELHMLRMALPCVVPKTNPVGFFFTGCI